MSAEKVTKKSSFVLNGKQLIESLKPHLEEAISEAVHWNDPIDLSEWTDEFTENMFKFVEEVNDWQFNEGLDPDTEEVSVTFVDGTEGCLVEIAVSYAAPEADEVDTSTEVSSNGTDPSTQDLVDEIIQRLNRLGLSVDKKSRILNILTE